MREPNDGYWSNVWNKKVGLRVIGVGVQPVIGCSKLLTRKILSGMTLLGKLQMQLLNLTSWFRRAVQNLTRNAAEIYFECQQLIHDDGGCLLPTFTTWFGQEERT